MLVHEKKILIFTGERANDTREELNDDETNAAGGVQFDINIFNIDCTAIYISVLSK